MKDIYIIALTMSGYGLIIALVLLCLITALMNRHIEKKFSNERNR